MARDERLVIRMSSEVMEKIRNLAEGTGVTMSAYCAFILGQHIQQTERVVNPLLDLMSSEFKRLREELPSEAALDTEKDSPLD